MFLRLLIFSSLFLLGLAKISTNISKNHLRLELDKLITKNEDIRPNEYVDFFLNYINDYLIHSGADPMNLPDIQRNFSYKPLFINYHGEFELTKGWIYDISTMQREGDANLIYNYGSERFEAWIPIGLQDLLFNYNYLVKIMNMGPTGEVHGKITDVKIKLFMSYNNATHLKLNNFDISDTGHISLKFVGNSLVDWLVNILTDVSSYVLHPLILRLVQNTIRPYAEDVVEIINEYIIEHSNQTIGNVVPLKYE